jgi:LuxR family maltose regulon positive regulatory protein
VHLTTGRLYSGLGRNQEALEEIVAAEHLGSQLVGPHALASQVTGWKLATQARLGMTGEARAALAALTEEEANAGEIRNARAVTSLVGNEPAAALGALRKVLDGTAPAIGVVTVIEAHLLAAHAHCALGDQHAANTATERALALAEPDRLVLPFAMTGAAELLESLPRHKTAHAALLITILDVLHTSSAAARTQLPPLNTETLSPAEQKVLQYLPTNLSRHQIAEELSVSPHTVSTHLRRIYLKLGVSSRSSAVQRARELRLLASPIPSGSRTGSCRNSPARR